jgi:hypothetical protein
MIEYAADIKILPGKTIRKRNVARATGIPAFPVVNKSKRNDETKKNDELKIPFDKWIMPSQPVGYIKYQGFDFF